MRCERATALLRERGPAFADVAQLRGGVQRYLEAFADGGLFAGRLFVYDPRGSMVGADSSGADGGDSGGDGAGGALRRRAVVVGRCRACAAPHDAYEARARCGACRQLVLLCPACRAAGAGALSGGAAAAAAGVAAAGQPPPPRLLCELCEERRGEAADGEAAASAAAAAAAAPAPARRRLRILCLHGFRQDARQFAVRCAQGGGGRGEGKRGTCPCAVKKHNPQ